MCLGTMIYSMATFIEPKSKCECVAMGGTKGIIEIWDLEKATFMMQFKGGNSVIYPLFTRGMVLAATDEKDGMLRVWLTDNFTKPFFEEKVGIEANYNSLDVSTDSQYITMAGMKTGVRPIKAIVRIWKVV